MNTVESRQVHTTGYPRSGNNWLSQLLSDLLSSPIIRSGHQAWFGDKGGEYIISFQHKSVKQMADIPGYVFFIYRDPRDVAVSNMFFANETSLCTTIRNMASGINSYCEGNAYQDFVSGWLASHRHGVMHVRYEELYNDPFIAIGKMLQAMEIVIPKERIEKIIKKHSFAKSRQMFREQLTEHEVVRALRKGVVGDWRNYFDQVTGKMIWDYFGGLMLLQGYANNKEWIYQLPERREQYCSETL